MELTPSNALLATAATKLGPLKDEVVFVGGAVLGLMFTDVTTSPPRFTKDVDVLIQVASRMEYYGIERKLLQLGFQNDMTGPVCRFVHGPTILDVVPSNEEILGFSNRWYPLAMETAWQAELPQGTSIRVISAPCFIATKLEAFLDPSREGNRDVFNSRDLDDILRVTDAREELGAELAQAPETLRQFVSRSIETVMALNYFEEAITDYIDAGRELLVLDRLRSFAGP